MSIKVEKDNFLSPQNKIMINQFHRNMDQNRENALKAVIKHA